MDMRQIVLSIQMAVSRKKKVDKLENKDRNQRKTNENNNGSGREVIFVRNRQARRIEEDRKFHSSRGITCLTHKQQGKGVTNGSVTD